MKTTIITLAALLTWHLAGAQIDYYAGKDTVRGKNVTYIIESSDIFPVVWLHNIFNVKTPLKYNISPDGRRRVNTGVVLNDTHDLNQFYRAVRETFTPEELEKLKQVDEKFLFTVIVELDGSASEVSFCFMPGSAFRSIPPDKLFTLENKIKEYMTFTYSDKLKEWIIFTRWTTIFKFSHLDNPPLVRQQRQL